MATPQAKSKIEKDNKNSYMQDDETKLKSGTLPLTFEGSLDREAMARALEIVMQEKSLSVRRAAELAGTGSKDIQRISNGEATIDKSIDVLKKLGCNFVIQIAGNEPQ